MTGNLLLQAYNPLRLGQKSRRDRDWESHNPPNRGCRGLGWVQSFEERRLRVTKSHF